MNNTELARVRADTMTKRPAQVTRAEPLHLTRVRPVATAVTVAPRPGRLVRFHLWREQHYVADQIVRVVAIAVGAAVLFLGAVLGVIALISSALSGINSETVGGALVLIVIVLVIVGLAGRSGHGHDKGHGFHWTKCD